MLTRKEKKEGWPEELRIPSEAEFRHGWWMTPGPLVQADMKRRFDELRQMGRSRIDFETEFLVEAEAKQIARDVSCGTQCCLVGWMGVAFNGPHDPSWVDVKPASVAHIEFARTILRLAVQRWPGAARRRWDLPIEEILERFDERDNEGILETCSDLFESRFINEHFRLKPHEARALWLDAAEHHGYDVRRFR